MTDKNTTVAETPDTDVRANEENSTPWAALLTDLQQEVRRIEEAVEGGEIGVRTYPEKATVTITYERGEDGSLYTTND